MTTGQLLAWLCIAAVLVAGTLILWHLSTAVLVVVFAGLVVVLGWMLLAEQ